MKAVIILMFVLVCIGMFYKHVIVVKEAEAYVIERLGQYSTTWSTGIHVRIPFLDSIAKRVNLKEQVLDFKPFDVITKDNVKIKVDTVVFFFITDPKLYAYGVTDPIKAIDLLTNTILRDAFGHMELDQCLVSRDTINRDMTEKLDRATDKWGIKVTQVELKDMVPPADIQEAMEKQMRAERERREAVLRAEGEKNAAILKAEGEKESLVLQAKANKEAQVLQAEAEKQARIIRAEGYKEAREKEAMADSLYIKEIREAEAQGFDRLKAYLGTDGAVRVRGYESLEKMADGSATKIIIPSELQGTIGAIAALKESIALSKPDETQE